MGISIFAERKDMLVISDEEHVPNFELFLPVNYQYQLSVTRNWYYLDRVMMLSCYFIGKSMIMVMIGLSIYF